MMVIYGKDYGFAYTVNARLSLMDLKIDPKVKSSQGRATVHMAVIMSKEYENREKLNNPEYEMHPLTPEIVGSLDAYDLEQLSEEVNKAYIEGAHISVETEKPKKK